MVRGVSCSREWMKCEKCLGQTSGTRKTEFGDCYENTRHPFSSSALSICSFSLWIASLLTLSLSLRSWISSLIFFCAAPSDDSALSSISLSVCACVCVCVHVHMCVCAHVCVHVCVYKERKNVYEGGYEFLPFSSVMIS